MVSVPVQEENCTHRCCQGKEPGDTSHNRTELPSPALGHGAGSLKQDQ